MLAPRRTTMWCVVAALVVALALVPPARVGASPARSQQSVVEAPRGWLAGTDGGVFALGRSPYLGSLGGKHLNQPLIALAGTTSGNGYWLAALDGGIFSFGDAHFYGSLGAIHLNQPIVDMVATRSGRGYWLVAADGGVFTFGDARFHGSLGAKHLVEPIAGMTPTPSGRGYWLVAADGGVFAFGDARFYGGLGGTRVGSAISALAATPDGHGYWLLQRDGNIAHFGDATTLPDAGGAPALAVALVPVKSGSGYWIAFADGAVRAYGDAARFAMLPVPPGSSVVGMATPWASSSGFALPLLEFVRALAKSAVSPRTWVGAHEAALTFDDGPGAYTSSVLGVLARYRVPATFFTVGSSAAAHPDLLAAESLAGMSVENHTWDHADLTRLAAPAIDSELRRTADAIRTATGRRPTCFRPPYGSTNSTVAAVGTSLGLAPILWNVDPSDYQRPGSDVIASRVLAAATGRGLVVIVHDGGGDRSQTVAALPAIIEGLRARGYTFVRLCA